MNRSWRVEVVAFVTGVPVSAHPDAKRPKGLSRSRGAPVFVRPGGANPPCAGSQDMP